MRGFHDLLPSDLIPIGAHEIINGIFEKTPATLLIMPGGRDLPYLEKLRGIGNAQIRSAVQRGMRYLGLCAGAYYACDRIEFEQGGNLEVVGPRELRFFPGLGKGPLSGPRTYQYDSTIGARALQIHLTERSLTQTVGTPSSPTKFFAYLNGGCAFVDAEAHADVKIFAEAQSPERSAVIIGRCVGAGRVLLSGVHIEYDLDHFDLNDPHLSCIVPKLKQNDSTRRQVLCSLVNWLME